MTSEIVRTAVNAGFATIGSDAQSLCMDRTTSRQV